MRISDWSSDVCSSDLHCSQEKEMHRLISCAAALAVLTLTAAGEPPTRTPMAEAALQKALAGRTPGKPESCVSLSELGRQRIIDRNTILSSEERRLGNECVGTCRSWWSPSA